jgi:uncharacterized cysteine cluster protein YcgN (CxxCxxCC family)
MSHEGNNGRPISGFWEGRKLDTLDRAEWEALCDGCAKCCVHKLEDADTGAVHFTNVRCRLLDPATCRCSDYAHRGALVSDCVTLTPANLAACNWLPRSCAYRRLAEEAGLPVWHPLITGDRMSVVRSGNSVCGRTVPESGAVRLEQHIVTWIR